MRNWDHLELADRLLGFVVVVILVLVPSAAAPFEMGREFAGSNAMWLGLFCGTLGGPLLMSLAACIMRRRGAGSVVPLTLVLSVIHMVGFVFGAVVTGVLSGFIAPCHASSHLEMAYAVLWFGLMTIPTGVMLTHATRAWWIAPSAAAGVVSAGWLVSGSAGMVMWGVVAWSASVLIPLAVWARCHAKGFPPRPGFCACGYELAELVRCPECGRMSGVLPEQDVL